MKYFYNLAKDKYLRVIGGLSLFLLLITAVIFHLKVGFFAKTIILHFDAYRGIDFLGSGFRVFEILLSVLVMLLINFSLADFLYRRERFLSYVFVFVSLEIAILLLIAVSVIISVN